MRIQTGCLAVGVATALLSSTTRAGEPPLAHALPPAPVVAEPCCEAPDRPGLLHGWWRGKKNCPPPSYPRLRYWVPTAFRVKECLFGPRLDVYPVDHFPGLPTEPVWITYPCQPVAPATLVEQRKLLP